MELIVITPTKLKIMLTPPDMKRYDLTPARMDCADEETRRSFRRIFDDARTEVGFDTAGERLFVQLFSSRGGGCEIFVTKLGAGDGVPGAGDEQRNASHDRVPEDVLLRRVFSVGEDACETENAEAEETETEEGTEAGAETITGAGEKTKEGAGAKEICGAAGLPANGQVRQAAFLFPELTPLLAVCRRLKGAGYNGESMAYILDDGRTCLLLEVPDVSFFRLPLPFAFLREYGQEADAGLLSLTLAEHAEPLCADAAVTRLGGLA